MTKTAASPEPVFLILQGPLSSFYSDIAKHLISAGKRVYKVHLCGNDVTDWSHKGALWFRGALEEFEAFLEHEFASHGITHILLHGDRRPYHKIAARWAKMHGIQVIATELGYLRPDWMTVERGACSTLSHFPNDPNTIRTIADNADELPKRSLRDDPFSIIWQEVRFTVFNALFRPVFRQYQTHRSQSPWRVYSGWLLGKLGNRKGRLNSEKIIAELQRSDAPYYVFALQLEGDFQLRDHSPFASTTQSLEYVIGSFANHGQKHARLVLKTHPHEFNRRQLLNDIEEIGRRYELTTRLFVVEGVSLGTVCKAASGFITVNSSGGFEALAVHCPCHCVMPTLYDVDGLTHQGPIDAFWQAATPPDANLFAALQKALANTIQVKGTLYSREGREVAAMGIAERLLNGSVNEPGGYSQIPPRLEKAKIMGVIYDDES